MRKAAAFPVALLLLSLGCGDDAPSQEKDTGVSAADTGVTSRNDGGTPTGETRSDASQPTTNDAGETAMDGGSDTNTDAGTTEETDAFADPAPDSGIIVVEGDAGTAWILTQQCPASTESDPCAVCEDTHCCDTYSRYLANPEARAYWKCADGCQAAADCEQTCATQHPTGVANVAVRRACLTQFCPAECGETAPTACTTCTATKCASQSVAASGNEDGYLFQACTKACGSDEPCQKACVEKHSTGAGLKLLLGDCVTTNCASECAPK